MRTLLLTEAPMRDLASRAILAEAAEAVPHDAPLLLATAAPRAPPGYQPVPPGTVPEGLKQILLTGVFLDRAVLQEAFATASSALAAGARLVVHNLGLEGSAGRAAAPMGAEVLDRAETLGVRDHRTANILTLWRVAAPIRILGYPERHVAPDPALADALPPGPILGLSIRGGEEMRRSWKARLPAIARLLALAEGWPVLPIPTRPPGTQDDDLEACRAITEAVLPGAPLLLPDLADAQAWRRRLTPARAKALVAHCRLVVTNRDLPAAYAIAAGVPVVGLSLGADRRIVSCMATLANDLPRGSALLYPQAGGEWPPPG